jgi:hypothetical protein
MLELITITADIFIWSLVASFLINVYEEEKENDKNCTV